MSVVDNQSPTKHHLPRKCLYTASLPNCNDVLQVMCLDIKQSKHQAEQVLSSREHTHGSVAKLVTAAVGDRCTCASTTARWAGGRRQPSIVAAPRTWPSAVTKTDLPAPLSPVMTLKPGCRITRCSSTSAKSLQSMCSSVSTRLVMSFAEYF